MGEKRCPDCGFDGNYCFKNEIKKIIDDENNNGDNRSLFDKAADINQKIGEKRSKAREMGCNKINDIKPSFPGSNLL